MALYLLDKKRGITSNKSLSLFKKDFGVKKAGFSGVLDPFATGLLIIATNGDTKFLDKFLHEDKRYTGTILFGKQTDTLDLDGETIATLDDFDLNQEKIRKVIEEKFIGKIKQVPPKFSNKKVHGERAHKLFREHVEFDLEPELGYDLEPEYVSEPEYESEAEYESELEYESEPFWLWL